MRILPCFLLSPEQTPTLPQLSEVSPCTQVSADVFEVSSCHTGVCGCPLRCPHVMHVSADVFEVSPCHTGVCGCLRCPCVAGVAAGV